MKKIYNVILLLIIVLALTGCTKDPVYYDVHFDANGGSNVESATTLEETSILEPESPEKEGYTFIGWFTDSTLNVPFDFTSAINGETTLLAKWEIIETYDVFYLDIEGDILQTDNFKLNDLIPTNSIPQDPEADGHTFLGWFSDEDLTTEFDFSSPIKDDAIIYSKWEVHQFTIEYIDYDTQVLQTISVDYGTSLLTLEDPYTMNRNGYIPVGWYLDEALTIPFWSSSMPSENVTAYAKWEQLPYFSFLDSSNPVVTVNVKDLGQIEIELFPNVAPMSVDNFIDYILSEDYTNNEFHRVIEGFMIQGGGFNNTECPITGEFPSNGISNSLSHYRGVLSMARTAVKDSATGQFFIVHEDSLFLDLNYATFGGMISGFDILDQIATVNTNPYDAPYNAIIIDSITVDLNGYDPQPRVCAE